MSEQSPLGVFYAEPPSLYFIYMQDSVIKIISSTNLTKECKFKKYEVMGTTKPEYLLTNNFYRVYGSFYQIESRTKGPSLLH